MPSKCTHKQDVEEVCICKYFLSNRTGHTVSSPCLQIIKLEDKERWSVFELRIATYSSSSPLFL